MKNTEYDVPYVTVVDDFTIIYKSQEEREGELCDSLLQIKTSKEEFLRKLRYFKHQTNEINQMKSMLIEENYPKEIFKEFISTLTTNKISLNENNYSTLLQLCNKFDYPELRKQVLKYSSSRPDIHSTVEEISEYDEDYEKEEIISTHLDICLRNENMHKFPIYKLIRILNSPKRVLNDHHLLYEFIKNYISTYDQQKGNKTDEKEKEENIQLLMSSLDYSRMSTEEMKEVFDSKYFSSFLNLRGTKEQMTQMMIDREKQEERIESLLKQIENQNKIFHKYEIEHQKQQQILASYESQMKEIEQKIHRKYEEDHAKQEESQANQMKRIKLIEEKINNKYKEKLESQSIKIKELENKIQIMIENPMKCQISVSVQPDKKIKGVINNENGAKLDSNRSKVILNKDARRTLGRNSYEEGIQITKLKQEFIFAKGAGTYYMHVLLTDNFGHEKEIVSESVTTSGVVYNYEFTGRVETVTLESGKYKLEVWGAEGGKTKEFSKYSGKGGYSYGTLTLHNTTKLYIHVGESPNNKEGGWNGGGSGTISGSCTPAGGGGSTDISLYGEEGSTNWNNKNHLYSRIIVAGAGGGSSHDQCYSRWYGGFGGGEIGQISGYGTKGNAGTQTSAGTDNSSTGQGFGVGGSYARNGSSGGGGGWYGGCASGSGSWGAGGSGGSGYVYNSSTASNYPSGCQLNSSFYLTNSSTIGGDKSIPNPRDRTSETGHSGHGYARITLQ